MSMGQVLEKLISIEASVNIWHQTLTSLLLLEKGFQLVLDLSMPLASVPESIGVAEPGVKGKVHILFKPKLAEIS